MKRHTAVVLMSIAAGMITAGAVKAETFTGKITDTMCGAKHTMKITPESKCVKECVRLDSKKWKYGLLVGDKVYVLSDQETPGKFAAQKVRVTGTLFSKTGILKADKIEATR